MTARDDFDRLVSSWFEENAPIREPEHLLGQVLARTARTRRRPSWLVPERWLSVQLVTRWQTVPRVAPLAVALMLLLALLAAALLLSGRPRLPAPFGPAANGLVAYMSGPQIVVAPIGGSDPRPLTPAADVAGEPVFSPLGRRIAYKLYEWPGSSGRSALYTADLETGEAIEVHPVGPTPSTPSWSPDEQYLALLATHKRARERADLHRRGRRLGSRQADRPGQRRRRAGVLTRRPAHRVLPDRSRVADPGGHGRGRIQRPRTGFLPRNRWRDAARRTRLRMVARRNDVAGQRRPFGG